MDTDLDLEKDLTTPKHEPIIDEEQGIEFFECQKCSEWNIITGNPKARRAKRTRHIKIDDVTWASLKRFAAVNATDLNYAFMLLLHNARTNNINYIVHERKLISSAKDRPKG